MKKSPDRILSDILKILPDAQNGDYSDEQARQVGEYLVTHFDAIRASLKREKRRRRRSQENELGIAEMALHMMQCDSESCLDAAHQALLSTVHELTPKVSRARDH